MTSMRCSLEAIYERVYDDGLECWECKYNKTWQEHHGDHFREPMRECQAPDLYHCVGVENELRHLSDEFSKGGKK